LAGKFCPASMIEQSLYCLRYQLSEIELSVKMRNSLKLDGKTLYTFTICSV
jgi:hypothetical protein